MSYNVICSADFGSANTGLTLNGKLFDSAGVQVGATVTTGFVEAIAGLYLYVLSAPDDHAGVFVIYKSTDASLRRTVVVAPRETEYIDAKTSTRLATSGYTAPDNASVTAIKAKTDNLPSDPADHSLVMAEIDAVLSAILSLNNLSSAGAQTAAAAALAAYDAATGADVTAIAAILAVTNPDPDEPGEITIQRGTTIDREITVEIIPAAWTSAKLTVKRSVGKADSEAVLQIMVSATPSVADGLQILNGSADATKTDASMTVTYATGKATFHLEDALTSALSVTQLPLWWDLKFYYGTSDSVATAPQKWNVTGIVTEAV
ncbi:MAG: hypothetical protein E6Q97_38380 [Desulfurellales bacterium]|nr:MAG: hypothetical protein E6Q97_38380 [Desulfurellales bacterium]